MRQAEHTPPTGTPVPGTPAPRESADQALAAERDRGVPEARRGTGAAGEATPTGPDAGAELPTRRRRNDGADHAAPPHVVIDLDLDGLFGLTVDPGPSATKTPVPDVATATDTTAAPATAAADHRAPGNGPAHPPVGAGRGTADAGETMPTHAGESATEADGRTADGVPGETALVGEVVAADGEPVTGPRALCAADLEAIRWRLDGATLREVVDDRDALRELGERLDEPLAVETDNLAKAGLLSVRAEVYRLLGQLGMAAAASRLALAHAESARDVQATVIAQAELAHVLRLRGDFAEADLLFARAAATPVAETLRSVVHENAGRCCFDQGRYMEALDHFARAIRLGRPDDTDLAARVGVCLDSVYIRVLRDGWGPYPRRNLDWGAGPAAVGWDGPTLEQPVIPARPR